MKKKIMNIKFVAIDSWNRPVFKLEGKEVYFGDVNKLWVANELGEDNKLLYEYYEKNLDKIEFFGGEFDCEPNGGRSDRWEFKLIK